MFAQTPPIIVAPPNISYQTPQTYKVGNPIAGLVPANAGGTVPAKNYAQVTTFAGSGVTGSMDGTGISASFSAPISMAIDANGNIYVADYNNNTIRKITPAGLVSTLAGNPTLHGSANGIGGNATFAEPAGVAVDKNGNVYVADSYNDLIRMITPAGLVTTFAGVSGMSGSANGAGVIATFNSPTGIAVDDAGNIYVADHNNNMIRKITPLGVVSTLAGNTIPGSANGSGVSASFNQPESLTVDAAGNVYVADTGNDLIREISLAGVVTTLAGSGSVGSSDGLGAAASFNQPYGISVDKDGAVYVADEKNNLIRSITPNGLVSTIAGNGIGGSVDGIGKSAGFSYPGSIVADGIGNIYVGDLSTFLIRKVGLTGYTIDKPLPAGLTFATTTGIISGTPTVASPATNYTITAYNVGGSSSTVINIAVTTNVAPLPSPPAISYQTPQIYLVNTIISPLIPKNTGGTVPANAYGLVTTFAGNGSSGKANGTGTAAAFGKPVGVSMDNTGNLFVSESTNNDVRKITSSDVVTTLAGGSAGLANGQGAAASFNSPYGLTVDASDNLYIPDENNQVIRAITSGGLVSTFAGSGTQATADGSAATADFTNPFGAVLDASGDLFVTDKGNSRIREIDINGNVTTFAVLDPSSDPDNNDDNDLGYITIDAAGNLYVPFSNQVEKIDPVGNITVVAGNGNPGFANGAGGNASFNQMIGITVDALGNIYAGDANNNAIRKITAAGVVTTLAGNGTQGSVNGIGALASFFAPYGVVVDNTGNFLYVADSGNNLIRKIAITGYAIDKPLPTGLVFDATTGIISGTPTAVSPATNYTVTAYNTGGSSSTVVNITVTAAPIIFPPIPPKTVCDADFDPGAKGNGIITYTSSNTAVATIVSGMIHITGAGTSNITASNGIVQAVDTLTVTAALVPSITISPISIDICEGSTVTYTALATNGGTNPVYQWQINGQNSGINNPSFSSNTLNNNDKITCVLTSNAVCVISAMAVSNTATFIVDPPITAVINISSSAIGSVCAGTPVTFTAISPTDNINVAYQWQVNDKDAGTNNPVFTTSTLADGDDVTCILISTGKCLVNPVEPSTPIKVEFAPVSACTIIIPNTITPNGDGINDVWNITDLQNYPACIVNIYNRYGGLIYNSVGYPKSWDGTYNGSPLPVGTYYYIIDLKNGKKPLGGYITILR